MGDGFSLNETIRERTGHLIPAEYVKKYRLRPAAVGPDGPSLCLGFGTTVADQSENLYNQTSLKSRKLQMWHLRYRRVPPVLSFIALATAALSLTLYSPSAACEEEAAGPEESETAPPSDAPKEDIKNDRHITIIISF